jgi:hypothetical protein
LQRCRSRRRSSPQFPHSSLRYQSALVVCDLVTAVLLFAQYVFLGATPLLALATGYLFTALMATAHALSFPGLFAPSGLLGAGPQRHRVMYMFGTAGFPALVIAYTVLQRRGHAQRSAAGRQSRGRGRRQRRSGRREPRLR